MRIFLTAVVLVVNLCLQSTVFQAIQIRGVVPDTMIVIIVSCALLRGSTEGAVTGFFAGLMQDLLFGNSIGYYACLCMLCGVAAGKAHKNFYRENYILPLLACMVTALGYETAMYLSVFFLRGKLDFLYFFQSRILPATVYTTVFSIPIYRLLYGVNEYLEEKERYKRRLF